MTTAHLPKYETPADGSHIAFHLQLGSSFWFVFVGGQT